MPGFFHETTSAIRTVNHNFHLKKNNTVCERELSLVSGSCYCTANTYSDGKMMSGKPKAGHREDTTKDLQWTENKFNNL